MEDPVTTGEYTGTYAARGYERGHLAPYNIAGGDRDGDLMYAVYPLDSTDNDLEDVRTICEINYMSNIAPQHKQFNNVGGLWYELERKLQDEWVENDGREFWVIAGCVLGDSQMETIGKNEDIAVPPMFYKIVIEEQTASKVLAFLFPHQKASHGEIQDFLVSVDVIETIAGFDFFPGLEDELEIALEDRDTWLNWSGF